MGRQRYIATETESERERKGEEETDRQTERKRETEKEKEKMCFGGLHVFTRMPGESYSRRLMSWLC